MRGRGKSYAGLGDLFAFFFGGFVGFVFSFESTRTVLVTVSRICTRMGKGPLVGYF